MGTSIVLALLSFIWRLDHRKGISRRPAEYLRMELLVVSVRVKGELLSVRVLIAERGKKTLA